MVEHKVERFFLWQTIAVVEAGLCDTSF